MTAKLSAEQEQETIVQAMAGVNVRLAVVTCGCGRQRALTKMYKCFYCETWVCQWCAPHHFGMTKEEYRQKKVHDIKEG